MRAAAVRAGADVGVGKREFGLRRRNRQVRGAHQAESSAGNGAVHAGQNRLAHPPQRQKREMHLPPPMHDQLREFMQMRMEYRHVATGHEGGAFSAHDYGPHRRIILHRLRNRPQLLHHLAVHRVQHLRTVEQDGGYTPLHRQQDDRAHAAVFCETTLPISATFAGSRADCMRPTSCGKSSTMMQARRSALKRRYCAASSALMMPFASADAVRDSSVNPEITPAFAAFLIFTSTVSPAGAACIASSSRPTGSSSCLCRNMFAVSRSRACEGSSSSRATSWPRRSLGVLNTFPQGKTRRRIFHAAIRLGKFPNT